MTTTRVRGEEGGGDDRLHRELLEGAKAELVASLGRQRYALWFRDAEVTRVSGRSVVLAVPTEVHRTWLAFTYRDDLDRAFGRVLGEGVRVELAVSERLDAARAVRDAKPHDEGAWRAALRDERPRPTLLSFLADDAGAFALRLMEQVLHGSDDASPPSITLYGEGGSGKTHLLLALDHALAREAGASLYLTARRLTARFVAAARSDDARAVPRLVDDLVAHRVVMLDGLDELDARPATQQALADLLDRAERRGVRFVVASRAHPRALLGLSDRLRSRLLGGVLVRLPAPSAESRARILEARAAAYGLALPAAVRDAIVAHCSTVHAAVELLDRWALMSKRLDSPLSPAWLSEIAPPASPTSPRDEVVRRAKDVVAAHYGIERRLLDRPTKHPNVLLARRVAIYVVWRAAALPLAPLAAAFGLRSHSAASRALAEIREARDRDPALETTLDGLIARL